MHLINKMVAPLIFSIFIVIANGVHGHPTEGNDQTLSPYFFVKSDDPSADHLPLKSTSAVVKVN